MTLKVVTYRAIIEDDKPRTETDVDMSSITPIVARAKSLFFITRLIGFICYIFIS